MSRSARAPWLQEDLLPVNPDPRTWGVLWKGEVHPAGLDTLLAVLGGDPGQRPEWPFPVVFVAAPGRDRILPAPEHPELQAAIRRQDAFVLGLVRRQQAKSFYPWLGICFAILIFMPGPLVFLPALFAMQSGSAFLEAWREQRRLERDPARYLAEKALLLRYRYWNGTASRWVHWRTWALAATWGLLFFLQMPDLAHSLKAAALVKPRVPAEPWRLLTGPMLHGSLVHAWMNIAAVLALGPLVDRSAHRHLLIPLWLVGALAGAAASWVMLPGATSVGASGGLMALVGFLAVMGWRRRDLLPPDFGAGMLRSILVMAAFGALAWRVIDNAGHGGGLAAGVLAGLFVFRDPAGVLPLEDSPFLDVMGWGSLLAFAALALFTMFQLLQP